MGVRLASKEWLHLLRGLLAEIVAREGAEGRRFSVCEVFLDAPEGLIGGVPGRAAWHFTVDGKTSTAEAGEVDWADVKVFLDYETILPYARTQVSAQGDPPAPILRREGNAGVMPSYLLELHNRAALRTD
jgi:hypothetical protein